jgi:hypothetical protein
MVLAVPDQTEVLQRPTEKNNYWDIYIAEVSVSQLTRLADVPVD